MHIRVFLLSIWLGGCFGENVPQAIISSNDIEVVSPVVSAVSFTQNDTSLGFDASRLNKIVGGSSAFAGDAPWQVYIESLINGKVAMCGGTLVTTRVVVTAAHCVKGSTDFYVGLGALDKSVAFPQEFTVKKSFVHKDYNLAGKPFDFSDDIAVLILNKEAKLDPDTAIKPMVKLAKLPPHGQGDSNYVGKKALVTGWGAIYEGSTTSPNKLQKLEVTILAQSKCKSSYGPPDWKYTEEKMICAGTTNLDKDACQGDSGGPLVYTVKSANILWGVVSYGDGCARKGYPGGYTKVTNYVNWIREKAIEGGVRPPPIL